MSTARHLYNEESDPIKLVEENVLSKALQGISFSCSGSLKIDHDWEAKQWTFGSLVDPPSAPPVIVRWDADGSVGKVRIPFQGDESPDLDQLIKNGLPATFGLDGVDVLDESYRKAIKLDCNQFSSNFHPHDHGILDIISQTLLPTVAGFQLADERVKSADKTYLSEDWGLVAELYKLNIYSAPSGRFKAHVDTPRGPRQWGSLVVCLPVSHQVLEVTRGHRLTLTYNLYVSEPLGGVVRPFPNADPSRYPLYEKAKALLEDASFMKEEGGTMGFYCGHHYAHTMKAQSRRLPYALKGCDAIFYSVFRHLGYDLDLRPILQWDYDLYEYLTNTMERAREKLEEEAEESDMEGGISSRVELDFMEARNSSRVGVGLPEIDFNQDLEDDQIVRETWEHETLADIYWLSEPSNPEVAQVHLAYGNNASLQWHYSSMAIIVDVPPYHERKSKTPSNVAPQETGLGGNNLEGNDLGGNDFEGNDLEGDGLGADGLGGNGLGGNGLGGNRLGGNGLGGNGVECNEPERNRGRERHRIIEPDRVKAGCGFQCRDSQHQETKNHVIYFEIKISTQVKSSQMPKNGHENVLAVRLKKEQEDLGQESKTGHENVLAVRLKKDPEDLGQESKTDHEDVLSTKSETKIKKEVSGPDHTLDSIPPTTPRKTAVPPTTPRKKTVTGVARTPPAGFAKFNTARYAAYDSSVAPPAPVAGAFVKFGVYDSYHLFMDPGVTDITTIPTAGVRLDDLSISRVIPVGKASWLNRSWPAEFDLKGMIRATRVPLGYAAKTWVNVGDTDVDGNVAKEGEQGWYYLWWGTIHLLCGAEGLRHGIYKIRPSFEILRGQLGWKKGYRCVVQVGPGLEPV